MSPASFRYMKHSDEGRLAVGGHQGDHLVLDGLHALLDFIPQAVLHNLGDLLLAGLDTQLRQLFLHIRRIFLRLMSTKGARWVRLMLWPPYWLEATWAMIWVAILQAVEKEWGFSIKVPEMTVPVLQAYRPG